MILKSHLNLFLRKLSVVVVSFMDQKSKCQKMSGKIRENVGKTVFSQSFRKYGKIGEY